MVPTWTVFARNSSLQRIGQVDDFTSLEMVSRFNGVGLWVLEMDSRAPLAAQLSLPGSGIDVVRHEAGVFTRVFSGPMRLRRRTLKTGESRLILGGFDDNVWLRRRLAHVQPFTVTPPYNGQAYDVRTGVCSTVLIAYVNVNLVNGSALSPRVVSGLTLAPDLAVGSTVTGRARWQVLLDLLQELAVSGGVGFGIRTSTTPGEIEFYVYSPEDKSGTVTFSRELGTLSEAEYESSASEVNYAVVGGSGEGTARTVVEQSDSGEIVTWGRIEKFIDRRDTADTTELTQAANESLAEGVGKTGFSLVPIDTTGQQYLTHYQLGNRVSAVLDGETVQEIVREITIRLTPEGPTVTQPTIGSPGAKDINRMFERLTQVERSVRNLERR